MSHLDPRSKTETASETDPEPLHPLLQGLNPVQREAVLHKDGPLLLFAGAGSGKTRVLTHRVAYLIAEQNVSPRHILAVTFTNKAAQEMRERIEKLRGEDVRRFLWVGTFHATCARILREFGEKMGLSRDFVVYDDGDQLTLMRECMRQLLIDDKKFAPRAILSQISKAKEQLITPVLWKEHYFGFFEDICGKVYPLYEQKLRQNNALDFDDLLTETVRLMQVRPDVLEQLQDRFRYIMVDEYQDVNFVQYTLVKLLAGKYQNLCVVGDEDQSIYLFRGANVELILKFENDFPEAKVLKLEQNYRSTKTILEAAYGVVKNNRGRKDKKLWTDNAEGVPLIKHEAENEQEEAVWIATHLREAIKADRRQWGDYAILYRTNAQSRVLEETFLTWQVPHRIIGGVRFYERKEVKDVMGYLRVIANPSDSVSLKRILNVPARGIGATTLTALEEETHLSGRSLWSVLQGVGNLSTVQARTRNKLADFVRMIQGLQSERDTLSVHDLTEQVLERSGYTQALKEEGSIEAQTRLENVQELVGVTREFEIQTETPTLTAFLEQVALISDLDSLEAGTPAVTLMTLHAAKGLEFPFVFLVGMEEGIFPHARSLNSDKELEEERRLCYVGITRAMEELAITFANRRTLFGNVQYNPPSRFLKEIPSELFRGQNTKKATRSVSTFDPDEDNREDPRAAPRYGRREPQKNLWRETRTPEQERLQKEGLEYTVGQKVRHAVFGVGVVLEISATKDDTQVSVAFPNVGIKKLLLSFAKLERVK